MATVQFTQPILKSPVSAENKKGTYSLLTFPEVDGDGDYLDPVGCRIKSQAITDTTPLTTHAINWEHGIPIGRGSVEMWDIPVDGSTVASPVGKSEFFTSSAHLKGLDLSRYEITAQGTKGRKIGEWKQSDCLQVAAQVAELVANDEALGVSIEFIPLKAHRTGATSTRGRPSMNISEWDLLTWAHCAAPVNPMAQVIENDLLLKSFAIADTGKLNGATLHPIILKAFSPLRGKMPKRSWVNGVSLKAMDDYADTGDGLATEQVAPGAVDEDVSDGMGDGLGMENATISQRLNDAAQAVADICGMIEGIEGDAPNGDYQLKPKLNKVLEKAKAMCAELRSYVDDLAGLAEKADAASGMGDAKADDKAAATDDEAAGGEKEVADEDNADAGDTDDDSDADFTKAFAPVSYDDTGLIITKSGYKPHRFKMSELKPVVAAPVDEDVIDETTLKAMEAEISRVEAIAARKERQARRARA